MNFNEKSVAKKKKSLTFYTMRRKGAIYIFLFKAGLIAFLAIFLAFCGLSLGFIQAIYQSTPSVTIESLTPTGEASVLYDNQNNEILSLEESCFTQDYISLNKIPQNLQNAVIAMEDPEYYSHNGINSYSIINSILNGFTKDTIYGNCSLITEELIENLDSDFSKDNNLFSRIEYGLRLHFKSISLEKNSSKPQILEYYLNSVSFGDGIIGVNAAAKTYFDKSVSELSLSECTILAAMISDPDKYNPLTQQEANKSRCLSILESMLEQEYITEDAMENAIKEDSYANMTSGDSDLPSSISSFAEASLSQISEDFSEKYNISATKFYTLLMHGNLDIYTTQDTKIQTAAEYVLDEDSNYSSETKDAQVSLTIMKQSTGEVQAIIGGRKKKHSLVSRSTEVTRQPGTLFHILATYMPGIDTGTLTLASTYEDSPYKYVDNKEEVLSKDGIYDGLTTIREAIPNEMNIIAARAQSDIMAQVSYEYLLDFGFEHLTESTLDSNGNTITDVQQSICSGSLINGVTNLEITQAVSTLGNSGYTSEPITYTKVFDKNELILLETEPSSKKTIQPSTAFLITDALQNSDTQSGNTSKIVHFTGSNQEETDYWCTGYTPDLTATVWLGYDDDHSFDSDHTEERIWEKIMDRIDAKKTSSIFTKPSNLVTASICQESGKLAVSSICDQDPRGNRIRTEYFTADTVPTTTCNTHVEVTVCRKSDMLISNTCPQEDYIRKIYIVLPAGSQKTADSNYILPEKYISDKRCTFHSHINDSE